LLRGLSVNLNNPKNNMKRLLGEMLVQGGEITQEQLDEALETQKKKQEGDLIGAILISLGYLDEIVLMEYLKKQGTHVKLHEKKNAY
jgi:MSHA biogenesis protein MshE